MLVKAAFEVLGSPDGFVVREAQAVRNEDLSHVEDFKSSITLGRSNCFQ